MKKYAAIKAAIEDMGTLERVELWGEYCDAINNPDRRIEPMDILPDAFAGFDMFRLLNMFYFGRDLDENRQAANPNREWWSLNGYGNVITTDYPEGLMDLDALADFVAENGDSLGNDDLQDIIDGNDD